MRALNSKYKPPTTRFSETNSGTIWKMLQWRGVKIHLALQGAAHFYKDKKEVKENMINNSSKQKRQKQVLRNTCARPRL